MLWSIGIIWDCPSHASASMLSLSSWAFRYHQQLVYFMVLSLALKSGVLKAALPEFIALALVLEPCITSSWMYTVVLEGGRNFLVSQINMLIAFSTLNFWSQLQVIFVLQEFCTLLQMKSMGFCLIFPVTVSVSIVLLFFLLNTTRANQDLCCVIWEGLQ